MSEFDQKLNPNSEDEEDEEETNTNPNTQVKKDKKKKKKNKAKNDDNSVKPQSAMAKIILERKRLQDDEDERVKKLEEEQERKFKEEEERLSEIKRKEQEEKKRKLKAKHEKIEAKKLAGTYKTKSEKERDRKNQEKLEQLKKLGIITEDGKVVMNQDLLGKKVSNPTELDLIEESENDHDSDSDYETELDNESNHIEFKCPIFTILGHVDVGKTSLLDNLRQTTVQAHEVGGITQQIGATLLTKDIIVKRTSQHNIKNSQYKIPGLLLVDTPGHEVFGNLRKKGIMLADIAIVIVDIVHGLEPQTIESINLLTESKTPFIFALNKLDRLYGFNKEISYLPIKEIILSQDFNTQSEFETRFKQIQTQIMELGLNCELAWNNNSPEDTISICPISAITSHGIPDLLDYIINYSQTVLHDKITWKSKLDCVVMEVSNVEGFGFVIDTIIKNGQLSKGDIIKVCTNTGIILTQIKNILTTPSNKDSKSTSNLIQHDTIKGSMGIKIYAQGLEKAIPGTQIELGSKEEYNNFINTTKASEEIDVQNKIQLDLSGIAIYTGTYGSLEAIVQFIRADGELPVPVKISQANIGNVMKKDLVKLLLANGTESTNTSNNFYPVNICVLAFESNIDQDAKTYAKENKITIFEDQTIYRLYTQYKEYFNKIYAEIKENSRANTVFPCVIKIIESNVFNKKNPLVLGVEVSEGTLHLGTPLIILPSKTYIGKVVGIQVNKQDVKIGKQGQSVCVKIDNESNPNIMYGRQFTHTDLLYSSLTRKSVDILKEYFKKELSKDDIGLLVKLKKQIGF
jgi:translation initiation factor 5B